MLVGEVFEAGAGVVGLGSRGVMGSVVCGTERGGKDCYMLFV